MLTTWILSWAKRDGYDNWPHGYEDLDQRFFKRSRRLATSIDDGDEPGNGAPDPGQPEPPIPERTEFKWVRR